MTLSTLVLMIGAIALILTLLVGLILKSHKSWLMTFLQNFCGALFIFSGWVKAVDPLGTAYKMEQYFGEFEIAFEGSAMSFLAPLFPFLSQYAVSFSVFMIVFEIVLGLMLLMGSKSKFTSWAFLILVAFFTVLTGFTFLTGYVPADANFFEFGKWGPYVKSNMKVTDCGCFGDFLVLEPKISFFKDLVLLVPSIFFVYKHKDMHELFSGKTHNWVIGASIAVLLLYCANNFVWNIPHADFRPFRVGVDVAEQKAKEDESAANVQIIGWIMENEKNGQVVEVKDPDYSKVVAQYPKDEGWKVKDQMKTEPTVAKTKISDFEVVDVDGNDMTESILSDPEYSFMIVSYKLYYETEKESLIVYDTTFLSDTIRIEDSVFVEQKVATIDERTIQKDKYIWDKNFQEKYTQKINPLAQAAEKDGLNVYAVTKYADPGMLDDFRHATQTPFPFYMGDDILLKTIVRSNPGVLLLKNGRIINKWHYKKLPDYPEIKKEFMN